MPRQPLVLTVGSPPGIVSVPHTLWCARALARPPCQHHHQYSPVLPRFFRVWEMQICGYATTACALAVFDTNSGELAQLCKFIRKPLHQRFHLFRLPCMHCSSLWGCLDRDRMGPSQESTFPWGFSWSWIAQGLVDSRATEPRERM